MKPIIMSTEDVRAVLDGRKTMMRIPVKPQPKCFYDISQEEPFRPCDVLWVRETWAKLNEKEYLYQADDTDVNVWKIWRDKGVGVVYDRWMSPVTMPRSAARLFLRVKDVRVERVQDITDDDSLAEGIPDDLGFPMDKVYCPRCNGEGLIGSLNARSLGYQEVDCPQCQTAKQRFANLWDTRNAKRGDGWDSNPLVWVIEFERTPSGAIGPEPDKTAPIGDKGAES